MSIRQLPWVALILLQLFRTVIAVAERDWWGLLDVFTIAAVSASALVLSLALDRATGRSR